MRVSSTNSERRKQSHIFWSHSIDEEYSQVFVCFLSWIFFRILHFSRTHASASFMLKNVPKLIHFSGTFFNAEIVLFSHE